METVQDFEDLLALLERHEVRYLIIEGLAFGRAASKDVTAEPEPSSSISTA